MYPDKPGHPSGHVESLLETSQILKVEGGGAFPKVPKSLTTSWGLGQPHRNGGQLGAGGGPLLKGSLRGRWSEKDLLGPARFDTEKVGGVV